MKQYIFPIDILDLVSKKIQRFQRYPRFTYKDTQAFDHNFLIVWISCVMANISFFCSTNENEYHCVIRIFECYDAPLNFIANVPRFFEAYVPCSRLFLGQCSLFPALFRPVFPVPKVRPQCSLFPAVFGPMLPVPGNPYPSPRVWLCDRVQTQRGLLAMNTHYPVKIVMKPS